MELVATGSWHQTLDCAPGGRDFPHRARYLYRRLRAFRRNSDRGRHLAAGRSYGGPVSARRCGHLAAGTFSPQSQLAQPIRYARQARRRSCGQAPAIGQRPQDSGHWRRDRLIHLTQGAQGAYWQPDRDRDHGRRWGIFGATASVSGSASAGRSAELPGGAFG